MFCRKCGRHIPEGEALCPACGYDMSEEAGTGAGYFNTAAASDDGDTEGTGQTAESPVNAGDSVNARSQTGAAQTLAEDDAAGLAWKASHKADLKSDSETGSEDEADPDDDDEPAADPTTGAAAPIEGYDFRGRKLRGPGCSIAGLILSIVSSLMVLVPILPVVSSLVGIILSICGLRSNQKGMAIAALVINIVFNLISLTWTIIFIVGILSSLGTGTLNWSVNYRF